MDMTLEELKFTHGPWYAVEYAAYWEIQDGPNYGDRSILDEVKDPCAKDNAILISKAPEMYSALLRAKESAGDMLKALNESGPGIHWNTIAGIESAYQKLKSTYLEINKVLES